MLMEEIEQISEFAQLQLDKENASNKATKHMLSIVEDFIASARVMCYGGTAINNLLPDKDKFYDPVTDIPDYDMFSETPQIHAMELADKLSKSGVTTVEVKPGMHPGTYKVFANFTGVADITKLTNPLFSKLWDQSVVKSKVHYVPPNFLRMSIYMELSRPRGDVSRWSKVYSRLLLVNQHYPIVCPKKYEDITDVLVPDAVRRKIEKLILDEKLVLLGFNASTLHNVKGGGKWKLPIDVLAEPAQIKTVAKKFQTILGKTSLKEHERYGEVIPPYVDIIDDSTGNVAVRIYETFYCHSYHTAPKGLRIASIPTLLQFFLSSLYGDDDIRQGIPEQRYLCAAEHLLELAEESGDRKYSLLTPIECIGKQDSLTDVKIKRAVTYDKLSKDRNSPLYLETFFTYDPTKVTAADKKKLKSKLSKIQNEDHSD